MVDLKNFYKKMDRLLAKIGWELSGSGYLTSIVKEIENTFGQDLHLSNGRIYEKNIDEFILIFPSFEFENIHLASSIPVMTDTVQLILNYRMYIFDNHNLASHIKFLHDEEYSVPVAFIVENRDKQWILAFELRSGWSREEIEFCLNAVRILLDYRLFSESIKTELEQAARIQKSLLPISAPNVPGYQIAGISQPAALVGGDFYDYFLYDDERFDCFIGDASGHGIPAALMARDAVIGLRMELEKHLNMIQVLKKLNSVIFRSVYSTGFITLFYAQINKDGNVRYVNAGHPSGFLVNRNKIQLLKSNSPIIGTLENISIKQSDINLLPGNLMVLLSDGILERHNKAGEFFGEERLKNLLLKTKNKNVHEILEKIFVEADEFGEDQKWDDDATIIVMKRIK